MRNKILIFLALGFVLQSCYKTQGPEYLDELDVTVTQYDKTFDFKSTKTVIVNDTVALRHDYLTDSQVEDFYKRGGTSDKLVDEIIAQFSAKGFDVKDSRTTDTTFLKSADLYVNPVMIMSKTTDVMYWPGYGWGGYYPGWGWGWGYYGYYSTDPSNSSLISMNPDSKLVDRSTDYYYYPPGWGWGGYYTQEYKTGLLTMEMAEGNSVRAYWEWFATHTPEEIEANPEDAPNLKLVWKAFIEGQVSTDTEYNKDRAERGFDEAFEQSYYFNK